VFDVVHDMTALMINNNNISFFIPVDFYSVPVRAAACYQTAGTYLTAPPDLPGKKDVLVADTLLAQPEAKRFGYLPSLQKNLPGCL